MAKQLSSRRYRIHVGVTKGDAKGRVLSIMKQGIQCGANEKQEALDIAKNFCGLAEAVKGHYSSYGCVAVIDEETNEIVLAHTL